MRQRGGILRRISEVPRQPSQIWLNHLGGTAITAFCLLGFSGLMGLAAKETNVELKVGVVQRFGEQPTDRLTLQAASGDRLTLKFLGGNMQPQTLQVNSVQLEVTMEPLKTPEVEERLVLSNHRSFETAEDSAQQWQAKGIAVEIAQPGRWQLWAKRDVYQTPLLRRLLLENLKTQGDRTAYLETEIVKKQPKVSWVINGNRYNREELEITATKNPIQVQTGKEGTSNQTTRLYAGKLRIQPNAYGNYTLVNQVSVETYLRGVVPHEIGPGAPYAAVEAQAIIARTYALRNVRRFAVDNYEICADTHCQVYQGLTGTVSTADRAIAATKNQVLTYQNELVDALYSSSTGGITAPFNDIWNGADRPYLRAVIDSAGQVWNLSKQSLANEQNIRQFISLKQGFNESDWGEFRWRRESTLPEIAEFLQRYLQKTNSSGANFKTVQGVKVVERSPAGRVLKMAVQTDKGVINIDKDDIRSAFWGPRSTLFYLDPIYAADKTLTGYAFVGGGLGHGVGLSQTGSYRLAKLGWSSQRILTFYYPGTQIQPIGEIGKTGEN